MGVTGGKLSKGVIMKKLAEGYRLDQAQLTSENNANSIVKGSGSYEHKGNDEQCGEPLAELLNGMSLCESKNVNDEATAAVNVGVNDVMCIVCEDHPPLVTQLGIQYVLWMFANEVNGLLHGTGTTMNIRRCMSFGTIQLHYYTAIRQFIYLEQDTT